MVSEILAARCVEVGSDSGTSTVYSFCNSDMETEAWANLASTFAAKEDDTEDTFGLDNSLRLYEEGVSYGKEVVNPPAVVVAATSHSEEVELLYSSAVGVIMQEYGAVQSQADSPLSSSSISTISTSTGEYDPFGKRSDFSLPDDIPEAPPLVRVSNFVQFDNMGKLDKERKSALHSIMECQSLQTGVFTDHSESTSSIECLVQWCGGGVN